ncbi:MAG: PIG-L family deacetylase [Bacteroidetes bacterium]|nr:MAG: PIG-L family deacetylase [Bacteroidota bacterium]TAG90438.1 MAG: PIG-L family deacetylase [Bacteroidota bacterium]
MKHIYLFLFIHIILLSKIILSAQTSPKMLHTGEILNKIKKLQVLGTALYLAAHPDDENTAVIAYLANERKVRTGYLSLTRGDGGQNLIGAEQSELLGLIRTQELLQARRIDGGEQFFTRANDFGFSKNAQETFSIWNKKELLKDVVRIIRYFKPDVIITRFPPNREAGHGHHEASMLLALEAFDLANDENYEPELGKKHQTTRLVWNEYSRGFKNTTNDSTQSFSTEIGNYNYLLGKSNLVIAAESRSMHKSQGFGSSKNYGNRIDWFQHFKGKKAEKDLFDNVELSWKRIPNSEKIQTLIEEIISAYQPEKPFEIVNLLLQLKSEIIKISEKNKQYSYLLNQKIKQIDVLLKSCLGLWVDANAKNYSVSQGDSLEINVEISQNSPFPVEVEYHISANHKDFDGWSEVVNVSKGKLYAKKNKYFIPKNFQTTQPYWLREKKENEFFKIENDNDFLIPENQSFIFANVNTKIKGNSFQFQIPVTYKYVKPEEGEIYRPLEITPAVMVNFSEKILLFANDKSENLKITIKAGKNNLKGKLKLEIPNDWKISPKEYTFELPKKDDETDILVQITPPKNISTAYLKAWIQLENESNFIEAKGIYRIEYAHIPTQTLFPMAETKLNRLEIKITSPKIGYIAGAGDEIPRYLIQLGYQVTMLDKNLLQKDLSMYQAIIIGVRAYNTEEHLKVEQKDLHEYVKNGGVLVVQYQTAQELKVPQLGVFPITQSRERVTEERAEVRFLSPKHQILNKPNQITQEDFKNWVQERGLYFASSWDKNYTSILSSNDTNEKPQDGGLLVANFGKGKFIYTGYSFFRQIPAGVSGAIRLFINLLEK